MTISDPEAVRRKVIALLRGYGTRRIAYVRAVAEVSPDPMPLDVAAAVCGSVAAVAVNHAAVEQDWAAKGMGGPFIRTTADGGAAMDPDLADVVLLVLHEVIDEPDPLVAALY